MRTVESTVYHFDELSDRAKERARDWYRNASAGDNDFADFVIEDAATIADLLGINLRQRPVRLMNGGTRYEPALYYTGFSSQGDGARFECDYSYKPGSVAAILSHAPQDERLHAIARDLAAVQKTAFYSLAATSKHTGRYSHEYSMTVDVENTLENRYPTAEQDEAITEALRDFARWIYRQLESAWTHENSDENVTETILANEYEFDEEGNRA